MEQEQLYSDDDIICVTSTGARAPVNPQQIKGGEEPPVDVVDESADEGEFEEMAEGEVIPPGQSQHPTWFRGGYRNFNEAAVDIVQNPQSFRDKFELDDQRVENFRGVLSGAGSGLGSKYVGKVVGPKLGSLVGLLGAWWLGDKLLKRHRGRY